MASLRQLTVLLMTLAGAAGTEAVRAADVCSAGAAACAAIERDDERVACYDSMYRAALQPAQPVASAAVTVAAAPAAAAAAAQVGSPTQTSSPTRPGGAFAGAWSTAGVEPFSLRPYHPIYLLPLSAADSVNHRPSSPAPDHTVGVDLPNRSEEVKFQLSAKTLLWPGLLGDRGDLWLAYTQSSRWQLYQSEISRPFRETNYEPEILFNVMTDWTLFGWTGRTAGLALNHQSNGRALPLSRSWNRLIGHVGFERGDWSVLMRPWLRLRESGSTDDNPDILDHMGRADMTIRRDLAGGGMVSLRLRHTLRSGDESRGAGEFEWAFPIAGRLHGYLQAFSGYGESLIDYNFRQSRIGFGFALAGWD